MQTMFLSLFLGICITAVQSISSISDTDAACQRVFPSKPNVTSWHHNGTCNFGCYSNGAWIKGMALTISDGGRCSQGKSCLKLSCLPDEDLVQCRTMAKEAGQQLIFIKYIPCKPICQGYFGRTFGFLKTADGTECRDSVSEGGIITYFTGSCQSGKCLASNQKY